MDGFSIRDVVDITPADGNLALACIIKQRGYVGIGFTEFHCTALRSHLVDVVLECFGKDSHPLFHANYKQQVDEEKEKRGEKRQREEKEPKQPKTGKEDGKKPKKPKKPKTEKEDGKKPKKPKSSSSGSGSGSGSESGSGGSGNSM